MEARGPLAQRAASHARNPLTRVRAPADAETGDFPEGAATGPEEPNTCADVASADPSSMEVDPAGEWGMCIMCMEFSWR